MGSGTLQDYIEGNAYLLRRLAECDAEIAALQAQVETMLQAQAYAENTILRQRWMMDAQKRTFSDAIAERDASIARMERQLSGSLDAETNERIAQVAEIVQLRRQVEELQKEVTRLLAYDCGVEMTDEVAEFYAEVYRERGTQP